MIQKSTKRNDWEVFESKQFKSNAQTPKKTVERRNLLNKFPTRQRLENLSHIN